MTEPTTGRKILDDEVIRSMVGRTVVRAEWFDQSPDDEWCGHEAAWLWLDDGRVIEFGGYGYDAWGATVGELGGLVSVESCLHCKKPHVDLPIVPPWDYLNSDLPRQKRFAFCVDGNHSAWIEQ